MKFSNSRGNDDKEDQDDDEVTFKLRWLLDFVAQPHSL